MRRGRFPPSGRRLRAGWGVSWCPPLRPEQMGGAERRALVPRRNTQGLVTAATSEAAPRADGAKREAVMDAPAIEYVDDPTPAPTGTARPRARKSPRSARPGRCHD